MPKIPINRIKIPPINQIEAKIDNQPGVVFIEENSHAIININKHIDDKKIIRNPRIIIKCNGALLKLVIDSIKKTSFLVNV